MHVNSTKIDFSPGSRNWIAKFFELYQKGEFEIDPELIAQKEGNLTHFISHQTGLIYGTANSFIFSKNYNKKQFHTDEKLQLLLFETLLFTYLRKKQNTFSAAEFQHTVIDFYNDYYRFSFKSLLEHKVAKQNPRKLELILASRIGVKSSFLGANFWFKHLSNAFIFLDIILFRAYLEGQRFSFFDTYQRYAVSIINALIYTALIDGKLEENEKKIVLHFIQSAALSRPLRKVYKQRLQIGITLKRLQSELVADPLLSQITYEYGHFILQSTHLVSDLEKQKLMALGDLLQMSKAEMSQSEEMCTAFIDQYGPKEIQIYKQSTESSFAFKETSKRWLRIIGRNKDRLITEIKESKELMELLQKSTKEELSLEEKEQVKAQFYDILKSMPSLALFLLPGGSLLLPIVMKLVPELIPSAFKTNEIDKSNKENEL